MDEPPKKSSWPIFVALVAGGLLLTPVVYVGAYLTLGNSSEDHMGVRRRSFDAEWQVDLFGPAAKAEEFLIHNYVMLYGPDD